VFNQSPVLLVATLPFIEIIIQQFELQIKAFVTQEGHCSSIFRCLVPGVEDLLFHNI